MEFFINKDSVTLKNTSSLTLMKPNRCFTRFILTSLNKNIITSYTVKYDVNKYGVIFSYAMDDLIFSFSEDSLDTYKDVIDMANMKRKRDMLNAYKNAINSDIKTYKIMVLPLSNVKNVTTFIENENIFTYQIFKERKELIFLNKIIDMYITKYGVLSNPRGIIVSDNKRLIGVDDYTKDIIDRKVLKYGKRI